MISLNKSLYSERIRLWWDYLHSICAFTCHARNCTYWMCTAYALYLPRVQVHRGLTQLGIESVKSWLSQRCFHTQTIYGLHVWCCFSICEIALKPKETVVGLKMHHRTYCLKDVTICEMTLHIRVIPRRALIFCICLCPNKGFHKQRTKCGKHHMCITWVIGQWVIFLSHIGSIICDTLDSLLAHP